MFSKMRMGKAGKPSKRRSVRTKGIDCLDSSRA